ncbi:MAG: DUF882 domain-containing protein [Desulfatibacillaceae bacterium]
MTPITRRNFLVSCAKTTAALSVLGPATALATVTGRERTLGFYNLHTGEHLDTAYNRGNHYLGHALSRINRILRDHRTGDVHPIDTELLDLLYRLAREVGTKSPFHVISGYRSPRTNAMLNKSSSGVAQKSLHVQGKAIDIRLPDVPLETLCQAAVDLERGGVGAYPESDFIHVDVGRVRYW